MNTNTTRRRALLAALKITGAAATIAVIGAGFVLLGPEGEVQESQADIADLSFLSPKTNTQRFVDALDRLGHEPPRAYSHNGARVYFSTATSPKRPDELVRDYQHAFYHMGVNDKIHPLSPPKHPGANAPRAEKQKVLDAYLNVHGDMLTGQVIPAHVDRNQFVMTGALINGNVKNKKDLDALVKSDIKAQRMRKPQDLLRAHRYIEATWDAQHGHTTVTASWSDEDNFDIKKLIGKDGGGTDAGLIANPDVPPCPGCKLFSNFTSQQRDEPFSKQIFTTQKPPLEIANFYLEAMRRRGWVETPASAYARKTIRNYTTLSTVPQRTYQFAHVSGGEFLTITVSPEGNETRVSTVLSN